MMLMVMMMVVGGGEDENDVKLFHHSLVHLTSGSALRLIKEGIMLVAHIHCYIWPLNSSSSNYVSALQKVFTSNKFCGFVTYIKDTFYKKIGKIGQSCQQQSPKQSTDSYTELPLPTR